MAIRKTQDIPNVRQKVEDKYRKACILKLKYVGEACVKHARLLPNPPASFLVKSKSGNVSALPNHQPNYFDWSSNLRSSIGFVIVDRGTIILSDFENKGGNEGVQEAKKYANELAAQYSQGLTLIVVAGMTYAAYIQRKGYDVTASAELIAEQLITQMQLNAKLEHPQ